MFPVASAAGAAQRNVLFPEKAKAKEGDRTMNEVNEIIRIWRAIERVDKERELFDSYLEARKQYLEGLKNQVRGNISTESLKRLYEGEREAFKAYLEHRTTASS
jgi:hypothetical protein